MRKKWILGIGYLYVLFPTVIFFLGWVKAWIAVPVCLLLVWSLKTMLAADAGLCLPEWNRRNAIRGMLILGIVLVWVYFSGIGNFAWQNGDHKARNALYEMLVVNEWPVVKSVAVNEGTQIRGLIYYLGYWLPAALMGKLFGMAAGYFFQYLWAVLGITICVVVINSVFGKWSVWPLLLFVAFSGLDALGCVLSWNVKPILSFAHLEWWNHYQFSSFTTQLYWVFNQAIYAWVLMALLMIQKNNKCILLIWSMGMLVCTFPAAGMIPFVGYKILKNADFRRKDGTGKITRVFNELLSLENMAGGVTAVLCFFYLTGNRSVQNSVASAASALDAQDDEWLLFGYILFIIVEIGFYYLYCYRYHKKNRLFYISLMTLLLCPLIKVGSGEDFCMRASIPSLLILYYMVADSIQKDMAGKTKVRFAILLILIVGSITAVHEIGRSVINTVRCRQQYHEVINPVTPEEKILQSNNFSGEIENNLFFQYLAK